MIENHWKDEFPKENRFFETDFGILYNDDALDLLPKLPSEFADLILTDPPYGISSEVKITRGRNKMKFKGPDISLNFGEWDNFENIHSFMEFTYAWLDYIPYLLRNGGMFISYFDKDKINFLSHYLQSKYNFKTKGYYADLKSNPVPQARKVKWMNSWEEAGLWQKPNGPLTFNYQLGQQKDYGIRPIVSGKERTKHPTQKPLKVISLFISYWSNPNDFILDPFVGSGTTALVAEQLKRRWIAIEKNEKYCEIAKNRLLDYNKQMKLF